MRGRVRGGGKGGGQREIDAVWPQINPLEAFKLFRFHHIWSLLLFQSFVRLFMYTPSLPCHQCISTNQNNLSLISIEPPQSQNKKVEWRLHTPIWTGNGLHVIVVLEWDLNLAKADLISSFKSEIRISIFIFFFVFFSSIRFRSCKFSCSLAQYIYPSIVLFFSFE